MSAAKSNVTDHLRARAEDLLAQATESFLPTDIADINKLHHELAVHQAELELQNEELRQTQLSLQKVRDLHIELYEHAPVGYVLLDSAGMIRRTNATWRAMLARPDDDFCGTPFAATLLEEDARVFLARFRSLFHNPADKHIELRIKRHNTKPFHAQITAKRSAGLRAENASNELMVIVSDISERKQAEIYRDMGREILQILNESGSLAESIQRVLATLKKRTKVDAVGLRLQEGEDFPYVAQDGFSNDFLLSENTLLERSADGGVCRDKDGNVCLECTCGVVLSGKIDASNPLFTKGGSCWTNDSFPMLDLPSDQDPRMHPRNNCIHQGYASVALIPVRTRDRIVGLIQLNDKRKDRFTLTTIEMLEDIAAHIGSALMRKQMEEELRESEERFKALHNASFGGIAIHDQGLILDCNQGLAEISGFCQDELMGMDDLLLIAETSREEVMNNIRSGYEKPYEVFGLRKNGEEYPLRLEARSIPYHGKMVRVVEFRDITTRKQNEQQLKDSEEKYRRLFETMVQGVLYQTANGAIVSANPAAEKILGLTFDQIQGTTSMDPHWQMIEEDGTPVTGDNHPAMIALRSGQVVGPMTRGVFLPDKNKHIWLNIIGIPLFRPEETFPYQVYATFEDITERKNAQDALRESLGRIEAIYAALDDAILLVDVSRREIIECNSATMKMFGYSYEEIVGKDTRFMHVDQKRFEQFGREAVAAYADPGYYATEFEMRRKDGSVFPTESSVRPVLDSHGNIVYVVSVVRDITERKQAQLALQQKNQEMEQFVYSVSHDLKSPLVTVKTFAGMLRQDLQNADQPHINEDLDYIDKAADKMEQLLDALLQYSRIGRVDAPAQTLSACQLVDDSLSSLAGIFQQHQVQVTTSGLTQQVQGDPLHFGQIWQNLIENAVKYRGDQTHPQIEIGATQQGHDVVFYVRDNGIGIAPEHRERIFNLFSQLNPESDGSGLGLALVKKIVSIYRGRIWVESEGKDKGSCFMFTLPGALINTEKAR